MVDERQIAEFLKRVDRDYPVPLSKKVDLSEYAQKLMERADIFVDVAENGKIQALRAARFSSGMLNWGFDWMN